MTSLYLKNSEVCIELPSEPDIEKRRELIDRVLATYPEEFEILPDDNDKNKSLKSGRLDTLGLYLCSVPFNEKILTVRQIRYRYSHEFSIEDCSEIKGFLSNKL